MSTMFKVQSGIPKPPIDRRGKVLRRKYPVHGMVPGQMFFVPGRGCRSVSSYISRITKNLPGKYEAQHVWMRKPLKNEDQSLDWVLTRQGMPGAVEGVGVWRTE